MRREVAFEYAKIASSAPLRLALGRCGTSLTSGEDTDLALTACELGWERGVFAALRLQHRIPAERLTEGYLVRLTAGIQFSSRILEMVHPPHLAPQEISLWWQLKYWCALATKFGRKRRFFISGKAVQREARRIYEKLGRSLENSPPITLERTDE